MIEEKKVIEKPIEKKPILNIKIDAPRNAERREEKEELAISPIGAMGVVLLSKKKTKNWLHVPARAKTPKTPLFPEKETEVVPVVPVVPVVQGKEEEEIPDSDDPVVLRGARVNLLGKYNFL